MCLKWSHPLSPTTAYIKYLAKAPPETLQNVVEFEKGKLWEAEHSIQGGEMLLILGACWQTSAARGELPQSSRHVHSHCRLSVLDT